MGLVKNIALYGTLFSGAFSLGFYKGYNAGYGNAVPLVADIGLIAGPIVAGGISSYIGPSKSDIDLDKDTIQSNNPTAIILGSILVGGARILEGGTKAVSHGLVGLVGSGVVEGIGIGAGYVVSKF